MKKVTQEMKDEIISSTIVKIRPLTTDAPATGVRS